MADPAVGPDLDLAFDVTSHLAAQVTFHLEVRVDEVPQLRDFVFGQIPHARVGGQAGLLTDQVSFINAALDLYEATGNVVYNLEAHEAAEYVLDFLEDKAEGGFFDMPAVPDAIGELAHPKKNIGENAEAALAFNRLSAMNFSDPPRLRLAADRALRLFADKYADYGYFSSSYARAVEAATAPGMHITIVGDGRSDERTRELQFAGWGFVAPAKTVETLDAETAMKRGLPADKDGRAYATVCVGTVCFAPVTSATEMTHLLASQGSSRSGRTRSK